jgi:hypothetical protein
MGPLAVQVQEAQREPGGLLVEMVEDHQLGTAVWEWPCCPSSTMDWTLVDGDLVVDLLSRSVMQTFEYV